MVKKDIQKEKLRLFKRRKLLDNLSGYGFLGPNIFGFFLFTLFPVIFSFILAFCKWNIAGTQAAQFIGLTNFIEIIKDPTFWKYFYNTVFYLIGIPFGMAFSLYLALLLNNKLKGLIIFRTIYFLPVVTTIVAAALIWRYIYNPNYGLLNGVLRWIGVMDPPKWLNSSSGAVKKIAVMIFGIWKGAGYNMLLYLAALQGIPHQLYEAADIDGANSWRKFWYITFPLLAPTNFFIIIMSVIGGFQMFDTILIMVPRESLWDTATIVYHIYNMAFRYQRMGYAAAISWILFFIIFIVTIFNWKYGNKQVETTFN
jgi:multiple sugar transport system permease protein